jgi:inorganic pyrophosphatase
MGHPWHDLELPMDLSDHFPVVIEIPQGHKNKYEIDLKTGLLRVDRVLFSAVHYPVNYGFVPRTIGDDEDPVDVLVLGQEPVMPLAFLDARAIGGFEMRDEHGVDAKIIAVHVNDPSVRDYHDLDELPQHTMLEIRRFFEDYKVLEHKQVVVEDMLGPEDAVRIIRDALEMYRQLRRGDLK